MTEEVTNPSVLGELILHQADLAAMSASHRAQGLCDALVRVPGVAEAVVCAGGILARQGPQAAPDFLAAVRAAADRADAVPPRPDLGENVQCLPLALSAGGKGLIALRLDDAAAWEPYRPYVEAMVRTVGRDADADDADRYRMIVEMAPVPILLHDGDRLIYANPAAAAMFASAGPEELIGLDIMQFMAPDDRDRLARAAADTEEESGGILRSDLHALRLNGQPIDVELNCLSIPYFGARARLGVCLDQTARNRLAEQTLRAERMEAVGQLAGGIAHDFRNQLTVISGYTELLLREAGLDDPQRAFLEEIRQAAQRSTTLTSQLLIYSRKQALHPELLPLDQVVADASKPMSSVLGTKVKLAVFAGQSDALVRADRNQLEQAILNLLVNARDAMPHGGTVTLETATVDLDAQALAKFPHARPGPYVMLAVRDTGDGMDERTCERIFEPFFTTKGVGEGTGLGLSMVYGFVQQSGGVVLAHSQLGRGTSIEIYLPVAAAPAEKTPAAGAGEIAGQPDTPGAADRTILVAEDEEAVRRVIVRTLRRGGYTVLESGNAREALPLGEHYDGTIHLLIADVVMPDLSGPDLARRLQAVRPGLKALFITGYADNVLADHPQLQSGQNLLPKPFTPADLSAAVARLRATPPAEPQPPAKTAPGQSPPQPSGEEDLPNPPGKAPGTDPSPPKPKRNPKQKGQRNGAERRQ